MEAITTTPARMTRILFVDDEPHVLDGLRRMLRDKGTQWEMVFETDPGAVADHLDGKPFDAVVLDYKMPGKDGLTLLSEIKARPDGRDIEVLLLTGEQDRDLKRTGLDLGVTDLLNKPVMKEDLVARLNSALRLRGYHQELQHKHRMLEDQLIRAQKMEVVGLLAAGAVHDFNNILSHISGYTQLAQIKLGENIEARERLDKVIHVTYHAAQVVRQILDFSRNRTSQVIRVDLARLLNENVDIIRNTTSKRIEIVRDIPEGPLPVDVTPTEFYQVIVNLCVNAKHALNGEGTLTIALRPETIGDGYGEGPAGVNPGNYLRVTVSDTGCGMDEETLARIFEPLFTTRPDNGGTGLGLPTVRTIMRRLGGDIDVDSTPGVGTTVSLYFPQAGVAAPVAVGHEAGSHVR